MSPLRPDPNCGWIDQGELDDVSYLVIVHTEGCRHRERGEHTSFAQPCHRTLLHCRKVGIAMVQVRCASEAVELQIDLDPLVIGAQGFEQHVVTCDLDAVGVDDDPCDRAGDDLIEQLDELRMDCRLSAGQHQDIDPSALSGEALVDVRQNVFH
jgi:hypothetical protein